MPRIDTIDTKGRQKMLRILTLTALTLASAATEAQTVGLHLASRHSASGYNDSNPGLYVRDESGLIRGFYCNSESRSGRFPKAAPCVLSAYVGWSADWSTPVPGLKVGLTGGLLTGYSRARVLPFVVPSLLVLDTVRVIWAPAIEPKGVQTFSLALERSF